MKGLSDLVPGLVASLRADGALEAIIGDRLYPYNPQGIEAARVVYSVTDTPTTDRDMGDASLESMQVSLVRVNVQFDSHAPSHNELVELVEVLDGAVRRSSPWGAIPVGPIIRLASLDATEYQGDTYRFRWVSEYSAALNEERVPDHQGEE